jgi:glucokinase
MNMYLTIDVGGSKILFATFSETGELIKSHKIKTPADYPDFIQTIKHSIGEVLEGKQPTACAIGLPGAIDRNNGIVTKFGNLPWENVAIRQDLQDVIACSIYLENDAKMASLAEAYALQEYYTRVLFITVSTGIGFGLVVDGKLDHSINDMGGHDLLVNHGGKEVAWESFASGKAIVSRTGKLASEIHDSGTWKQISKDIAIGLAQLVEKTAPQVIVVGGGVGAHLGKFQHFLFEELELRLTTRGVTVPQLRQAQHPEEAVVYGGYLLVKSHNNDQSN